MTEADWAGAEAVVVAHYQKLGHKTVEIAERFVSWPFMMRLFVDEEFRAYEIVVGGKVVTHRGVLPLERYLDTHGVYARANLTIAELLDVIHVFDAWPKLSPKRGYGDRTGYATEHSLGGILPSPSLERVPDEQRVRLYYPIEDVREASEDPVDDHPSPPDGPILQRVGRWDLILRRGKPAKWTETLQEHVRE